MFFVSFFKDFQHALVEKKIQSFEDLNKNYKLNSIDLDIDKAEAIINQNSSFLADALNSLEPLQDLSKVDDEISQEMPLSAMEKSSCCTINTDWSFTVKSGGMCSGLKTNLS